MQTYKLKSFNDILSACEHGLSGCILGLAAGDRLLEDLSFGKQKQVLGLFDF